MITARLLGITFVSFVVAWLVITLVARWLFGSGNFLVWVVAAVVAAGVYLEVRRRDRRRGRRDQRVEARPRDIAQR